MSVPEPGKILTPWATSGLKNIIPQSANPVTGNAGFDQGFPAINMTAKEAGGIPPFGQDFNGIFYEITNILRYMQAGGQPTYSANLATAIGGYPKGALVVSTDGGISYRNMIDGNASNPDAGGAGWVNDGRFFPSGSSLPTSDIGPIWHDDYNDWMVWRTFSQNGANYTGYASRLIGSLLLDTQPTPRAGYIKSGVQNLSRTTYAALRAWAIHNGLMVAPGVWAAGTIRCADNADGTTFRLYDARGEFLRAWDDGRGVDAGRVLFSAQADAMRNFTGSINVNVGSDEPLSTADVNKLVTSGVMDINRTPFSHSIGGGNISGSGLAGFTIDASRQVPTAIENRPRNTALLAAIKF